MAWDYFLFWNGFETGLQPEEKGKSPAKMSSTPRSGRRKRRAISPAPTEYPPPLPKPRRLKETWISVRRDRKSQHTVRTF